MTKENSYSTASPATSCAPVGETPNGSASGSRAGVSGTVTSQPTTCESGAGGSGRPEPMLCPVCGEKLEHIRYAICHAHPFDVGGKRDDCLFWLPIGWKSVTTDTDEARRYFHDAMGRVA